MEASDSAVLEKKMGLLACHGDDPFPVFRDRGNETLLCHRVVSVLKTVEIGARKFDWLTGKDKMELGIGATVGRKILDVGQALLRYNKRALRLGRLERRGICRASRWIEAVEGEDFVPGLLAEILDRNLQVHIIGLRVQFSSHVNPAVLVTGITESAIGERLPLGFEYLVDRGIITSTDGFGEDENKWLILETGYENPYPHRAFFGG